MSALVSAVPLFVYAAIKQARGLGVWNLEISSPILVGYTVFFPLPAAAMASDAFETRVYEGVELRGVEPIEITLIGMALCMTLFVSAYSLTIDAPRSASRVSSEYPSRRKLAAVVLVILAYSGLIAIVLSNGGFDATIAKYGRHSKDVLVGTSEQFGWTLWSLCAAPAVWFTAADWYTKQPANTVHRLCVVLALGLVVAGVLLFASRRDLLSMSLGVLLVRKYLGSRNVSKSAAVALATAGVLVSFWIVDWRVGGREWASPVNALASNLSHGVLESLATVVGDPDRIYQNVASLPRFQAGAFALVPRVLWPTKPTLADTRLDVVVARAYGSAWHRDTGFPTSAAAEWVVIGGWTLAAVAFVGFGLMCAQAHNRMTSSPTGRERILLYVALSVWSAYYFKDGDLVMSLAGGAKVVIVTWMCAAVEHHTPSSWASRRVTVA